MVKKLYVPLTGNTYDLRDRKAADMTKIESFSPNNHCTVQYDTRSLRLQKVKLRMAEDFIHVFIVSHTS